MRKTSAAVEDIHTDHIESESELGMDTAAAQAAEQNRPVEVQVVERMVRDDMATHCSSYSCLRAWLGERLLPGRVRGGRVSVRISRSFPLERRLCWCKGRRSRPRESQGC